MYMNIDEIEQELGVMQLSDSFFPTGIFATSNRLEFLFRGKKIQGMTDLIEMIKINIIQQMGHQIVLHLQMHLIAQTKMILRK